MMMPERKYQTGTASYRYGFQNQESDPELWGDAISYKFRVEDPRLNRFFSVDPLAAEYPHNSPYAFAENRLIDGVELEGLEWKPVFGNDGKSKSATDYSWSGFNVDGSRPEGTEGSAKIEKGGVTFSYSSSFDKSTHRGTGTFSISNKKGTFFSSFIFGSNTSIGTANNKDGAITHMIAPVSSRFGNSGSPINVSGASGWDLYSNFTKPPMFYDPPSSGAIESDGLGPFDYLLPIAQWKYAKAASKIYGVAQVTSRGHAFTSNLIAWRYAFDPRVEKVTLDLGYKRLLGGGMFKWGPRPDVGVLFKNGAVKAFEVMSKTDIEQRLFNKNFLFMQRWGIGGSTNVVKPYFLK